MNEGVRGTWCSVGSLSCMGLGCLAAEVCVPTVVYEDTVSLVTVFPTAAETLICGAHTTTRVPHHLNI